MLSAKQTVSCFVWHVLVVMAALPSVISAVAVACEGGCICNKSDRSVVCASLNLTSVPIQVDFHVHSMNLSANRLQEINENDFVPLQELRLLDLSSNRLSRISAGAFRQNAQLQSLHLDHNVLDDVSTLGVASLQELYLSSNRISSVNHFSEFSSLSILDVSGNGVTRVPSTILASLPNLQKVSFAGNRIGDFVINATFGECHLRELNLSSNLLVHIFVSGQLTSLEVLDLSWNLLTAINPTWFIGFRNLRTLILTGNPMDSIPDSAFGFLPSLTIVELSFLQNLTNISFCSFCGVWRLENITLTHNSRLRAVDDHAFHNLTEIRHLDLSNNELLFLRSAVFSGLTNLRVLDLSGNPWICNCDVLPEFNALNRILRNQSSVWQGEPVCAAPPEVSGQLISNLTFDSLDCRAARIRDYTKEARHQLGSSALLNCVTSGDPKPQVVWVTNRNLSIVYTGEEVHVEQSEYQLAIRSSYDHRYEQKDRIHVLENGSLYISYVTRKEGGIYQCVAINEYGNDSVIAEFQLNYEVMSSVTLMSIIMGFLTAAGFFLLAVIIGVVRYVAYFCSKKERKKRKSIREVLETIQDYKTAQFDKFRGYRTAKMDQLSAFKSAKIDQFSAFRHSRVDKIRTYKQATVTNVLHHLERMREHYACQTARIKDNCSQQMDKLRESYGVQRGKFKDYRSLQVEKMRENYNAQVLKIREYSIQQMTRLREQYKAQQQNLLKLLELLDIGNCVTVIEAECMHTESIIFDASIAFDFEAHPIHVPRDSDSNASSEELSQYLTASESSGLDGDMESNPVVISFTADVEPIFLPTVNVCGSSMTGFRHMDSPASDSGSEIFLESFQDPAGCESAGDPGIASIGVETAPERETEC